ncbi:thioredoxin-like protein [Trametes elegans]|nr:thioredoxin-like protein [Trametes elegans]
MAPTEQITLYSADYSPFAQRVRIALEEADVKYTMYEMNTRFIKPEWYYTINPFGKVPALTFGGPNVPPDQPSAESAKLVESMVILEFLADVFPEARLLPADPIQRAKARQFVEIYRNYVFDEFRDAFFRGKPVEGVLAALEKLQDALPPKTGFAAGAWSIADAAVAPLLAGMVLCVRAGIGAYTEENWQKLRAALESETFARFMQYIQDIHERPSFKKTWGNDDLQIEIWQNHPGVRRLRTAENAEGFPGGV